MRRPEPLDEVARVAHVKRMVLLRVHRHLLCREDLEDCYSQATLELLVRARRGASFVDEPHVENTLELRFISRVRDLRRARGGRSPMHTAMTTALSLTRPKGRELALMDPRADVESLVEVRSELRQVPSSARHLSGDQKLALACQLAGVDPEEVRLRFGWSADKYRKAAQRGRSRLKALMSDGDL